MTSARERMNEIMIERHAERMSVYIVRGVNFTHIQKLNDADVACEALDENGEKFSIYGKDIYNKKTWEKFLLSQGYSFELGWLTGNAGMLAHDYAQWLFSGGYTKRYQYLKGRAARRWLRKVARLAILLRIMDYKRETHNFVDAWAECQMDNILMAKEFVKETNKGIGHALKHEESIGEIIESIHLKYLGLLEGRSFVPFEPLPELPEGTPDPLALPEDDDNEGEDIDE